MAMYPEQVARWLEMRGTMPTLLARPGQFTEELLRLRGTADAELAAGEPPAADAGLVRAGLLYLLDAIGEAHRIVQSAEGDLGAYWHGMIHRREGDFDNARYWFRRAGELGFFPELHRAASVYSADVAKQIAWDPYLMVGQCEQNRFGEEDPEGILLRLQRAEFDAVFGWSWERRA